MKHHHKSKHNIKGFTIVELMISTVIFSLVMVLCLTGMVQVSRAYYKGITHSRTQEAGRILMDEISKSIQLSGSSITPNPSSNPGPEIPIDSPASGVGAFCVGNKKYSYILDRRVVSGIDDTSVNLLEKETRHALISEDEFCADVVDPATAAEFNSALAGTMKSLLNENMRLTRFTIIPVIAVDPSDTKSGSELWEIKISIAYGDQDLIQYTDDQGQPRVICRPGTGSEFCSIVELSKIVSRRIG